MSALTSLLVRDDAVSVRQIEDALQRQVLEGGALDTALLEQGALPENVLIAYRALSEHAEPASREDVMGASVATRALLSTDLACSLEVAPVAHDEARLVVASHRRLTAAELAALEAHTGLAIEGRITCELRVHAALERFYGRPLTRRLASLLRRVDAMPAGELVSIAALKVSAPAPVNSQEPLPSFDESEDFEAALESAFERVSGVPRGPASPRPRSRSEPEPPAPGVHVQPLVKVQSTSTPHVTRPLGPHGRFAPPSNNNMRGRAAETEQLGSFLPERGGMSLPPEPRTRVSSLLSSALPPPTSRSLVRLPQGPLTAAVAERALAEADERDAVMEIYFRFARQYFDTTLLLAVKGERVRGVQAHNAQALQDVHDISVPVLRGGALDDLNRTLVPRIVDLSRKDEDRVLALAMKRNAAQPCAMIPICIKRRVVALIYGDRSGEVVLLDELGDLLALAPHVTRAFERIIHARKALGVGPSSRPEPDVELRARDLPHAPTQRSIPLPLPATAAVPSVASALADAALVAARAQEALTALGLRRQTRTPFQGQAVIMPEPPPLDNDGYATERVSVEPMPLDGFDAPARYLSKPPPGTGRYRSIAPRESESTDPSARPEPWPGRPTHKPSWSNSDLDEETQPLRPSRAPLPSRTSLPPARSSIPSPASRTSLPPPASSSMPPEVAEHLASSIGRASLHASKPAPGTGAYHSQAGTTEMISSRAGALPSAPTDAPPAPLHTTQPPAATVHPVKVITERPVEDATVPSSRLASHAPRSLADTHTLDMRMRAEQLLNELCQRKIDQDLLGVQALLALGDPALSLLLDRFPGPLWFDRRRAHARVPFGRDLSPICRALDAFGDAALERFGPLLRSRDAETRYYATLFACDRVHPALLEPLLERLFDDDPQIRLLVRDVLPHYRRLPGFAHVAERLCAQAVEATAPLRTRLAAIDAIAVLRDAASVPTLIELSAHVDKQISVPAHRALTAITCQDFGKAPKKWRAWFEANVSRHRVEWLIEGLMHPDEALRSAAGLELQKQTQVYYGYVAAASKRDRELSQKRYWNWWHAEGRQKL